MEPQHELHGDILRSGRRRFRPVLYKSFVLVPTIGSGLPVTTGIARADGAWAILTASAVIAAQFGQLAGTLTRFTAAGVRGERPSRAWSRTVTQSRTDVIY